MFCTPAIFIPVLFSVIVRLLAAAAAADADTDMSLLSRLSDPEYRNREAATKLLKNRPEAIELVRKASGSPDPEVARRAVEILKVLSEKTAVAKIPRLRWFAAEKIADCFTEGLLEFPDRNSVVPWQLMIDFGYVNVRECAKACKLDPTPILKNVPTENFAGFSKLRDPRFAFDSEGLGAPYETILYRGESLSVDRNYRTPLAAVRGKLSTPHSDGFAYVNGPVDVGFYNDKGSDAYQCVLRGLLLVDGSVDFHSVALPANARDFRHAGPCVIVAKGDVSLPKSMGMSIVLAGGDVIFPVGCRFAGHIRCGGKAVGLDHLNKNLKYTIRDNDPRALEPFRFFDLALIGLAAKGFAVSGLDAGSPLLKAGLAKGDVILEVDGVAPKTAEDLRKALRTGYVRGDAKLKVLRGKDTKELAVAFPLPEK